MTPPTPVQNSYASFASEQERYEMEGWRWRAKDKNAHSEDKTVSGKKPQCEGAC